MKNKELARRVARALQLSPGDAADSVNRVVAEIRKRTRKGQSATLPGLGRFLPGSKLSFENGKRGKGRTSGA